MKNTITNIMDPYYTCADGLAILLKIRDELSGMYNSVNSAKIWQNVENRIIETVSEDEWFIIGCLLFNDDLTDDELYNEFFNTGHYNGMVEFIANPDVVMEQVFNIVGHG